MATPADRDSALLSGRVWLLLLRDLLHLLLGVLESFSHLRADLDDALGRRCEWLRGGPVKTWRLRLSPTKVLQDARVHVLRDRDNAVGKRAAARVAAETGVPCEAEHEVQDVAVAAWIQHVWIRSGLREGGGQRRVRIRNLRFNPEIVRGCLKLTQKPGDTPSRAAFSGSVESS